MTTGSSRPATRHEIAISGSTRAARRGEPADQESAANARTRAMPISHATRRPGALPIALEQVTQTPNEVEFRVDVSVIEPRHRSRRPASR